MTKTTQFIAIFTAILFAYSFQVEQNTGLTGVYGVSSTDPAQIKLIINADQTFHFQDFSDASRKINVDGTWTSKRNKLVLKSAKPDVKFHNIWMIERNGQIAKSRKGLTFYRLCKMAE